MSLLWQYFLSYLVVMLVLIFGIATYTRGTFYTFHQRIVYGDYQGALELIRERNESELLLLMSSSNQLAASADVSPFIFKDNPEKFIRLKRQLSLFASCNDFFSGMYLIFNNDDYVYSTTTLWPLATFLANEVQFDSIMPEEIAGALRDVKQIHILPEQELSRLNNAVKKVVPVFMPIGYLEGTRCGTVMYQIDSATYDKLLGGIATGNKNVYILKGEEVIFAREVCPVPREAVLHAAGAILEGEKASDFTFEDKKYMLYRIPGDKLELSYLMLASASDMSMAFTGTMKLFMVILAILFAVCLLVVIYFVQLRVRPIRRLHKMIVKSAPEGNELIEIRDGVQRLIDDNAALNTKVESVETLRRADFARRFLVGGFADTDDWLSMAEEIHLNVDMRFFAVSILAKPTGADYELIPDKLNRLFDDHVGGVSCTLGLHDKILFVSFANNGQQLYEWLEGKLAGIRACCTGVTMAVSAVHKDYKEGPLAYLEAENAFEKRFVRGNTSVIRFDGGQEEKGKNTAYNQQLVERLRLALKALDEERVRSALDDITRTMGAMNTSLFVFRCMYNDILSVITREVRDSASLEQDVHNLYKLSECLSLDDLDIMLRNVCSRFIAEQDRPEAAQVPPQAGLAMDIIRRRFSEPGISVSSIAQELGISESKLSLEFKAAFQVTPLECLTQHKMQQACRLLKSTDMPVKDIAVECGNYEISGFNRRFKAYTGKTPQQYRQSFKKEPGEKNWDVLS